MGTKAGFSLTRAVMLEGGVSDTSHFNREFFYCAGHSSLITTARTIGYFLLRGSMAKSLTWADSLLTPLITTRILKEVM